jgi:hypothetical protein
MLCQMHTFHSGWTDVYKLLYDWKVLPVCLTCFTLFIREYKKNSIHKFKSVEIISERTHWDIYFMSTFPNLSNDKVGYTLKYQCSKI